MRWVESELAEKMSGDCTRESGGERGKPAATPDSGKSSRNFDMVRRGTLDGLRIILGGVARAVSKR